MSKPLDPNPSPPRRTRWLFELFSQGARTHPTSLALETATQSLTFGELMRSCLERADEISGKGIGPEDVVMLVCEDSSTLTYIDYLAACSMGLTVVPVSYDWPMERLKRVLERISPVAAIGCVDPESPMSRFASGGPLHKGSQPQSFPDAALIFHTSGSTGTPKAVPVSGLSIATRVRMLASRLMYVHGGRNSHNFRLTFDPSLLDLFATWLTGGTVVVPTSVQRRSPRRYIHERRLTHWNSVPTIAQMLSRDIPCCRDFHLTTAVFGGEELTLRHALRWRAAYQRAQLFNVYGPTEGTIACFLYELPRGWVESDFAAFGGRIPIGAAIDDGWMIRELDKVSSPDIGELCITGPHVFDGYIHDQEGAHAFLHVASKRFGCDDSPVDRQRFYRTGDVVERFGDLLVFCGRIDDQVQVGGYRVDIAEVEAVADRLLPGRSVCIVPDACGGVTSLAAFYTGDPIRDRAASELLGTLLPPYMVPAKWCRVAVIPRDANGKVVRHELSLRLGSLG